MIYTFLRRALFLLDAEKAHNLGLTGLSFLRACGLSGLLAQARVADPANVMGITFPNRVGLAAGLDKNGAHVDALAALGFGHIEVGTVTPRPQPGNPKPRLFRLPEAQAIINRMGFNNKGVEALVANLKDSDFARGIGKNGGVVGVNIGKNADTPLEKAAEDYLFCLEKAYAVAHYVTLNISSPNTQNLRELQKEAALDDLLRQLKAAQTRLADQHGRYVPLALKIAPDMEDATLTDIADAVRRHRVDAVIAANTTVARAGVEKLRHGDETGGLSGAPEFRLATTVLGKLAHALQNEIPLIGVGGILKGEDARAKMAAGASLVQLFTGFIYRGPTLIHEVAAAVQTAKRSTS
ncbi:MAG: quinone-dependent dihydroorotate dehydrogenase [Zoogloeaceae bacterium]|jgi:dihydroorotate dehydrogenase|nr:quinone-dependent dihydroorotate dehydrogenase [Zoogloeaceae bacterium]